MPGVLDFRKRRELKMAKENKLKELHELEGTIWVCPNDFNYPYMFTQVGSGLFCMIGLKNGNRYMGPSCVLERITEGFIQIPNAEIVIEVPEMELELICPRASMFRAKKENGND